LLLSLRCAARAADEPAVWIDTDPAIGAAWREVDDAFALVLAFHSPELRIAGISTTYGNAGVKRTTAVARDLVNRFGASSDVSAINVHAGAASPQSLGAATPATEALATALRREKLTYLALGPLTNLATFARLHPELMSRVERVVFVGGRTPGRALAFGPTGGLQIHDANVYKDPASARAVLQSGIPVVLAPAELGGELALTRRDRAELKDGGRAAQFLYRRTRMWMWFWTAVVNHGGGPLFDSLAVIQEARADLVRTETRYAAVRASGELIAARERFKGSRAVTFCTSFNPGAHAVAVERLRRD
jgi:pyrimidine-specific ribonucleoside hydrolase